MFALEDSYWWFVGRRAIIEGKLNGLSRGSSCLRVLDLGCGTGANLSTIEKFGKVIGLDASRVALQLASTRQRGRRLTEGLAEHLPFRDGAFDVVTCLDVLEHLKDDCCALREVYRVLRPGGTLIATVPSYPWLWSEHDEALGHHRRYTKKLATQTLRCAGLRPHRISFVIALPLFPAAALRLIQNLARSRRRPAKTAHILLPKRLNRALVTYLEIEARLLEAFSLPFGLSLLLVAQRA